MRLTKLALIAVSLLYISTPAASQTFRAVHTTSLILAGNSGTDPIHTATIYAPAITSSYTITLPDSNALGALVNDGNGHLTWSPTSGAGVTSFSAGSTGFSPNTASSGAIVLSGVLNVANGGTGNTTGTAAFVPFSGVTASTNTAALLVGTGGSLGTTGSGTITATSMPASGLTGSSLPSGITGSSLTSVGTLTNLTVTNTITGSISGNANTATTATNGAVTAVTNNASYYPLLVGSSTNQASEAHDVASGISFNPSTNTLTTTTFSGALSGNATTATSATSATNASNVPFSGVTASTNTAALLIGTGGSLGTTGSGTITATSMPASGLTGSSLPSGITGSSLTSVGTLTNLTVTNTITGSISGNANTATTASNVPFSGVTASTNTAALLVGSGGSLGTTGSGTITATSMPASGLTGSSLPSGITGSSLTSVGTLTNLTVTNTITGSISGNANTATTATNGAVTAVSNNASYYPLLVGSSTNQASEAHDVASGISFNPSTNTLTTTTFSGALSGNATTATSATSATNASNVPFSGVTASTNTAALLVGTGGSLGTTGSGTITATSMPASGLTGSSLPSGITGSSLTSVGTLTNLTVTNTITGSISGNANTATTASNVPFSGVTASTNTAALLVGTGGSLGTTGSGTITATSMPASGLTGSSLPSGITGSSLTSVGTLTNLTVTNTITGSISGNANTATTATNGAVTAVSNNASYYPLLVGSSTNQASEAHDVASGISFNPSTNTLTTTTFSGALSGNATTATSASTATTATNITTTNQTSGTYYPAMVSSSSSSSGTGADVSAGISFNAATDGLSLGSAGTIPGCLSLGDTGAALFSTIRPSTTTPTYSFAYQLPSQTAAPASGQVLSVNGTPSLSGSTYTIPLAWSAATNNPMTTIGDMIYASNTATPATPARLAAGANGQIMTVSSGIPSWTTATYPLATAANTLLFSSSANTITAMTTQDNQVLVTNGSGVPGWSTSLPSGVTGSSLTSVGTLVNLTVTNPISGSVTGSAASFTGSLAGDVTGTQGATAINTNTAAGTHIVSAINSGSSTGQIDVVNGGTGVSSLAAHGVVIGEGTSVVTVAVPSTAGYVLTSTGGSSDPTWQSPAGDVTGTESATTISNSSATGGHIISALTANGGTLTNSISGTAAIATQVTTTQTTASGTYYPLFAGANTSGNQGVDVGTGLTFNPSTNTLTTTTFSGALSGNATSSTTASNLSGSNLTGDVTNSGDATSISTGATAGGHIVSAINSNASTGTIDVQNGGTGASSLAAHGVLVGEGTSAVAVASPSTSGYVLTSNGSGADPTWQILPSGSNSVLYNISPSSAQSSAATSGNALFDVEYQSAGVANAIGATIKSIATSGGTATGLSVSATGSSVTNNAIVATFNPGSASTGVSIDGTSPTTAGNSSVGLSIGVKAGSNAPDIGAYIDGGGTSDIQLGGGYSHSGAYALQFVGQGSDPTDAAIGVTGTYSNGFLANSSVSGMYGKTTATSVVTVNSTSHFGGFIGSFGVRGEATGNGAGARIVGVWGLASNTNSHNTGSIGVRAQGDSVKTVGSTNMALDITNGELTMGRTTDPSGMDSSNTIPINPATNGLQGPSGMDSLTTGFGSVTGPSVQIEYFNVGNEYCSAKSIVLVTIQNDPDAGHSTFYAQTVPSSGSFKLILTRTVADGASAAANPSVDIGYVVINPSR